ncbi:DJ-1/PfpI family protein [Paenibacillus sp. LHD-38]|uniref:DJ-1/PfpI family protein n=1 Tax=Paenibacillus sp. LHD-38 TaxID=3072143 RepID=UPI00280F93B2|nr:DJ-1/PfpI family protein [Paenibacillus sp. LHD-38]MDQ8736323.1 DJ-1/PfpI family protein [Paenibacillus sp. LHD-38]
MKIAFILFDGVTFLDFVGFYDGITRLKYFEATKDFTWDICALQDEVTDELGMTIKINKIKPALAEYDIIFIPGGFGTRALRYDESFMAWIKEAKDAQYLISVCTGSLLLGAAGFLENKKATTHPYAYDLLTPYCQEVVHARIVKDGNVITGGGVATSIDLALYVNRLFLSEQDLQNIKKQMDYPYDMQNMITF